MKIKIGNGEYVPPFMTNEDCGIIDCCILDADGVGVQEEDIIPALNELSQLRAENAALVKRVEEFSAVFDQWWEHYTTQQPNANKQEGWAWIDEAWDKLKEAAGNKPDTKGGE